MDPRRPKIRKVDSKPHHPITEHSLTSKLQACDLCYRKRIKCDGQTPRCSHCQIYECQCTHKAARRPKKAPRSRLGASGESSKSTQNPASATFPTTVDSDPNTIFSTTTNGSASPCNMDLFQHDFAAPLQMQLPPERQVRQVIETYLADVNSILPLFDPQQLTRTVDRWYHSPIHRSRTSWAVINITLAMAQHCSFGQAGTANSHSPDSSVTNCLNKAQSALTEMLMGDVKLENLQVVLGLVIVFQSTSNIKPAIFLISTALRLCQLLGVHRNDSECYRNADARTVLQIRRVFWISYTLDRNLAFRTRQIPIQQDTEVSIELPPITPDEDDAGFVSTSELHQPGFNVFRAHVELSQIQGLVCDALFSVSSQQLSSDERMFTYQSIRLLLDDWKSRIPAALFAKALLKTQSHLPCLRGYMCMLYGTIVACLGQLCQVTSMDFRWVDQLRNYGRSMTTGQGKPCFPPPLPQGWTTLVQECRELMPLFNSIEDKGPAFIW